MYSGEHRHVCMLPKQPDCLQYTPTANFSKRLACHLRLLAQAASWHSGTARFFRSQKSLASEQQRQAAGPCYILHPYSPLRFFWDSLKMAIIFMFLVYAPLQIFVRCPDPLDPLLLFSDLVAFVDILLNFITGTLDVDITSDVRRIVLEPKMIAFLYLKNGFIWDLISALPLQVIQPFPYDCDYPTHTVFLIFKLFRMRSFNRAWKNLCYQISLSYVATVATTVIFRLMLVVHWLTYFHYQVPCISKIFHTDSDALRNWLQHLNLRNAQASLMEKYIANMYRVFAICLGTGAYDPQEQRLLEEMVLGSVLGILGLFFLVHSLTALLRLIIYILHERMLFGGQQQELEEYMRLKRTPPALQQKVQLFINYKFKGHYFHEPSILATINDQIKQEINMFSCKRLVGAVPLFRSLPVALINTIIFSLAQVLYMPGEVIVKCGNPGSSLYLIASGTVAVMDSTGTEVGHLKDGACWGERALLQPGVRRSITVVALEITEIYKLSSSQFLACVQLVPRIKRRLLETLQTRPKADSMGSEDAYEDAPTRSNGE